MKLGPTLLREPRDHAEIGERGFPALHRPVRAVRRGARGDEERETRAGVLCAGVAKRAPVLPEILAPTTRVVLPEALLWCAGRGLARADRTPGENMADGSSNAVRQERLTLGVHAEVDAGRPPVDQLRRGGGSGACERDERDGYDGGRTHGDSPLKIGRGPKNFR